MLLSKPATTPMVWPTELEAPLRLKCQTSKGGAVLLLSTALFFVGVLLVLVAVPDIVRHTGWVLLLLLLMVAFWVSFIKLSDPLDVLELSQDGVQFFHRRGSWQIDWKNLDVVLLPSLADGSEFAYLGFRIRQYQPVMATMPLRLQVQLLKEQRHLMVQASAASCQTGACASDYLMMIGPCQHQGVEYRGVQGMFVSRMLNLRQFLSADLFIPQQSLPCSLVEACQQINRYRLRYQN